jgi:hypothetical protein
MSFVAVDRGYEFAAMKVLRHNHVPASAVNTNSVGDVPTVAPYERHESHLTVVALANI